MTKKSPETNYTKVLSVALASLVGFVTGTKFAGAAVGMGIGAAAGFAVGAILESEERSHKKKKK